MSEVGNSNRGLVRHLSTEDSVPQVNIEINKTSDKGFQKAIAKHNRGEVLTTNEISASSGALNQYSIEETIGVGAFSLVRRVVRTVNGEKKSFALKILKKSVLSKQSKGRGSESAMDWVRREIALMKKLNHPNIVQLFEVIESRAHHTMFLVLEYVSKGQILDRISDSGYKSPHCESGLVPLQTLRSYARDILRGLLYLHCMNIAHRDIKPENILLSSRNVCKLADFGVSELVQPDAPHNLFNKQEMLHLHDDKGTYHFYAPECVNIPKNGYSGFKADMWAVGITFLSCLTGKLPFYDASLPMLFDAIANPNRKSGRNILSECPQTSSIDDSQFLLLIDGMLHDDPTKRIDCKAALLHPWVTGEDGAAKTLTRAMVKRNSIALTVTDNEVDHALQAFNVKNIKTFITIKMKVKNMKYHAQRRIKYTKEFYQAVGSGNLKLTKEMLNRTIVEKAILLNNPASSDPKCETPLHCAAMSKSSDVVHFLLEAGAFPNVTNVSGETPLHLAAKAGRTDICNVLISHGAQVHCRRAGDNMRPVDIAHDKNTMRVLKGTTELAGIGQGMTHKAGRHSVKNPLYASEGYQAHRSSSGKIETVAEWVEVERHETILCSCWSRAVWERKYMVCEVGGKMILYDTVMSADSSDTRRSVSNSSTVYRNDGYLIRGNKTVVQVNPLQSFSTQRNSTLQLILEDSNQVQEQRVISFESALSMDACLRVVERAITMRDDVHRKKDGV